MSKRFIAAAAGILAAGLVAGTAATASASVKTSPTPSPSYTHPAPPPQPRAALWQFDFSGVNTDGLTLNNVRGTGALAFNRWQESDLNPFTSKFASPTTPNSVTLRHNRLPVPVINIDTCTATFDQTGRFRIVAGQGIGANLRVVPFTSRYILRGLISFDRIVRHGYGPGSYNVSVCPLQLINPFILRHLVETNNLRLSGENASLVDFGVQGNARLVRVRPLPVPYPTGPGHFFAPTADPSESLLPA